MTRQHVINAFLAALLTALLTIPILGVRLIVDGPQVRLEGNVMLVLIAVIFVFIVQLLQALITVVWQSIRLMSNVHYDYSIQWRLLTELWKTRLNHYQIYFWIAVIAGAFALPLVASRGMIDIATLALIYVMLGLGLNIVVGFAGLLDLGYVAFYAVGAYSYALIAQQIGWSFWQCLPISIALAALAGFLLGFPVLRLRGDYLAIVTLGFGEIIRLLLNNLDTWTGGPNGIGGIPKPTFFGLEMARTASQPDAMTFHAFFGLTYRSVDAVIFMYLLALCLVLMTWWIVNRLIRMPIGRAWEALREDEIACRSLGLNPTLIKLSAFTLGAAFGGMAGAFFAARQGFINPESFTFIESAIVLAIVILGGMGSPLGVIIAAIALTVLPEIARQFEQYRMLIFGAVMVSIMIWRPQGLLPAHRPHLNLPQSALPNAIKLTRANNESTSATYSAH